jgi:hypothetical protein
VGGNSDGKSPPKLRTHPTFVARTGVGLAQWGGASTGMRIAGRERVAIMEGILPGWQNVEGGYI